MLGVFLESVYSTVDVCDSVTCNFACVFQRGFSLSRFTAISFSLSGSAMSASDFSIDDRLKTVAYHQHFVLQQVSLLE